LTKTKLTFFLLLRNPLSPTGLQEETNSMVSLTYGKRGEQGTGLYGPAGAQ
jgi:hypothetical protein